MNTENEELIDSLRQEIEQLRGLLEWLNDECPPATMTLDLSHDFADILRNKLDKLLKSK